MTYCNLKKNVVTTISVLILITIILDLNAQPNKRTNFWYFNDSIGLDFNSGAPVENFSGMAHSQHGGTSTMCDTNGNLLFYSNSKWIWNKNHEIMENGYAGPDQTTSYQGTICMPKPSSDSLYYVFKVGQRDEYNPMIYNTINLSNNNGLGKVIDTDTLDAGWDAVEHITSTYLLDKENYWIITRKYDTQKYAAFLVNSDGVNTEPVLSNAPELHQHTGPGFMKISHNKKYLVN